MTTQLRVEQGAGPGEGVRQADVRQHHPVRRGLPLQRRQSFLVVHRPRAEQADFRGQCRQLAGLGQIFIRLYYSSPVGISLVILFIFFFFYFLQQATFVDCC